MEVFVIVGDCHKERIRAAENIKIELFNRRHEKRYVAGVRDEYRVATDRRKHSKAERVCVDVVER